MQIPTVVVQTATGDDDANVASRTKIVMVRLTPDEYLAVKAAAGKMPVSEWFRQRALGTATVTTTVAVKPPPPPVLKKRRRS